MMVHMIAWQTKRLNMWSLAKSLLFMSSSEMKIKGNMSPMTDPTVNVI